MYRPIVLGIGLLLAASAGADPIEGIWRTHNYKDVGGNLVVDFSPCNGKFCGKILYSVDLNDKKYEESPYVGQNIILDMIPDGKGSYKNGMFFDPNNGKLYTAQLVLQGRKLRVKTCFSVFCNTRNWTRFIVPSSGGLDLH